ncbi:hypothetical protein MKW98_008311, partial [Papaver atlanticum]
MAQQDLISPLYTKFKVVRNEDLYQQIGRDVYYDLVDHDKVRSIWVYNSTPFNRFKVMVAGQFRVPDWCYWMWLKNESQTCGPYRPLAHEEDKPVGQLKRNKTIAAELILSLGQRKSIELNQTTKIRGCRSRRLCIIIKRA